MGAQLWLPFDGSTPRAPTLPCAFGETGAGWDGPDHCAQCHTHVNESVEAFKLDVIAGRYDERGFTPAERRYADRRNRKVLTGGAVTSKSVKSQGPVPGLLFAMPVSVCQ